MSFRVDESIDCGSDLVWAVATDWSKAAYWLGVQGLRPIDRDEPVGEGTKLYFTARGNSHATTVTRWEPCRALTLESIQGGVTAVYAYTFTELDGVTQVQLEASCSARGWFWKLLLPLIAFFMKRSDSGQLVALKRLTEALVARAERDADALERGASSSG